MSVVRRLPCASELESEGRSALALRHAAQPRRVSSEQPRLASGFALEPSNTIIMPPLAATLILVALQKAP